MAGLEVLVAVGVAALGVVNLWLLFAVKSFKDELTTLRNADADLGKAVAAIQILVAGQYITRTEFRDSMATQTATILQRMEDITKRYTNVGRGDD
jgi:hypothetical protein